MMFTVLLYCFIAVKLFFDISCKFLKEFVCKDGSKKSVEIEVRCSPSESIRDQMNMNCSCVSSLYCSLIK